MNKQNVERRVDDWIRRLNGLFDDIEQWRAGLPEETTSQPGNVTQRLEDPMKDSGVEPRELPTYTILFGKRRISFVPSALWIIGANGRVNITADGKQYMLVDLGGATDQPSNWNVVTSQLKHIHVPFNEGWLSGLVSGDLASVGYG